MTTPGFNVVYHPKVVKDDIPRLAAAARSRIRKAIEVKLTARPEVFGAPLRGTLTQLWKMRVGDHRVINAIAGREVRVLVIAHRREVYDLAQERD